MMKLRVERWMAVWMLVIAFLMVRWFDKNTYYGVGVFLTVMVYGISILVYARLRGRKQSGEAWFWLGILALCGSAAAWVYNQSLAWFQMLFLRLTCLYFTAVVFGTLIAGGTSRYLVFDGIWNLFLIPVQYLTVQFRLLAKFNRKTPFSRQIACVLAGTLAGLPVITVVACFLGFADDNFSNMLVEVIDLLSGRWAEYLICLILSLPLSAYLYGQLYGCVRKHSRDFLKEKGLREKAAAFAVVPLAGMIPTLAGVAVLYLVFIGLQGSYYLGGLRGVLPEGFTYAGYARQGFFELAAVSVLNLGLLCGAMLLVKRSKKKQVFLRSYTVLMSILTLFLILTAMEKMALYIRVYGLTPKRVIASVFMVFLAAVFLMTAVSRFKQLPVTRLSVCLFAAGFSILCWADLGGQIASYNLNRYAAGTLDDFPVQTLYSGGMSSIPAMHQVWTETGDAELKQSLETAAEKILEKDRARFSQGKEWKYANRQRSRAREYLEEMCGAEVFNP